MSAWKIISLSNDLLRNNRKRLQAEYSSLVLACVDNATLGVETIECQKQPLQKQFQHLSRYPVWFRTSIQKVKHTGP